MKKFFIESNKFLKIRTQGYHNRYYYGYREEGNPDFINDLKNTFAYRDQTTMQKLNKAKNKVMDILIEDIPNILDEQNWNNCIVVCVPRAKANMQHIQMYFREAVSESCDRIYNVENGSFVINRVEDTKTTHLSKSKIENNGEMPYSGITEKTCIIDKQRIEGKNVILIDDIYTNCCNVDEDCIQALYNNGAKKVVFYAIAYTKRRYYDLF